MRASIVVRVIALPLCVSWAAFMMQLTALVVWFATVLPAAPKSVKHFPGDPPAIDMLLDLGVALVIVASPLVPLLVFLTKRVHMSRIAGLALLLPLLIGSTSAILGVAGIVPRHFGEWGGLKAALATYGNQVAQLSSSRDGHLTPEEFERAEHLFSTPVTYRFSDLDRSVTLRPMRTVPPFVGVDFGGGANAVFDPVTMRCVYSD